MKRLFLGLMLCAMAAAASDLTFRFVDSDGNPIPNGKFYFYQLTNGTFVNSIYRHQPMDASGSITVHDVPSEWEVGCVSSDGYFSAFHESSELNITSSVVMVRIPRTGMAELRFADSALRKQDDGPFVVSYDSKDANGSLVPAGGIGIFLTDKPFTIQGLPAGIYRFRLKRDYETNTPVLWSSTETAISNGETIRIEPIVFD